MHFRAEEAESAGVASQDDHHPIAFPSLRSTFSSPAIARLATSLGTVLLLLGLTLSFCNSLAAAPAQSSSPYGKIEVRLDGGQPGQGLSLPLKILLLLSLLTFIPAMLISLTCFTRIVIVFHFLRQAIGTQETPSNQILLGLALFMTIYIMQPVGVKVNEQAIQPMIRGEITEAQALDRGIVPVRQFMLRYTRKADLSLFLHIAKSDKPASPDAIPTTVLIPAFMISELKTAFEIGFILFIPFLIIDVVVASVLLSLGMLQLPPIVISTPFKILLFVMVDGWNLVIGSLVKSFY